MIRVASGLAMAVLLVGCACTQDKGDGPHRDAAIASLQVDPMVFVVIYHTDFENRLQRHSGDCEGTLAALMRFVADNRQVFQQRMRSKPAGWQPDQARSKKSVDLLMEFGADCPSQVARLNESIHTVTQLPEGS